MHTDNRCLSVLLADDNNVSRELASLFLAERGFDVKTARDGREALVLTKEHHFDLIILDLRMPGLDGYAVAVQIRSEEATLRRHMPLLALTADNSPDAAKRCEESGFDGMLIKPVSNAEFFSVIERVMKKGEREVL